jgi:ATP-dependent Clp protease ATP-binding subunit ClpA
MKKETKMYERFTDRARKVMAIANQEAQRFNHEHIGTEHLLIAIVKEGSGVGCVVLQRLESDLELSKLRMIVEKTIKSGKDMVTMGKLPQTPKAKRVIECAIGQARSLNHNYVGSEHLLLGLLEVEDGNACKILKEHTSLTVDSVKNEIINLLGGREPCQKPDMSWLQEKQQETMKAKCSQRKIGATVKIKIGPRKTYHYKGERNFPLTETESVEIECPVDEFNNVLSKLKEEELL